MKEHELKTWDEFMTDIATGKKPFEVRKNDREFEVGDRLILHGWDNTESEYTDRCILADVTYILHGGQWGIEPGYCVMGIKIFDYNF